MIVDWGTADVLTRPLIVSGFLAAFAAATHRRRFGYAAFYALAAIEAFAGTRHLLSGALEAVLLDAAMVTQTGKRQFQLLVLGVVAAAAAIVSMLVVRNAARRSSTEGLIAAATLAVAGLLMIETVSHHDIDAMLYARAGPVASIGWLYLAAAIVAVVAIERSPRPRQARRPS